jgi:CRP/FNR family transcriptional regulator
MLLVLYERFGQDTGLGEHVLDLPVSRQDLAALIGIAPESMSRTIRRLEEEQFAQFDGRRVHLGDLDRLFDEIELQH